MTRPSYTMHVTTRRHCDKMDHVNGNLAGAFSGSFRSLDQSSFLRLQSCCAKWATPRTFYENTWLRPSIPLQSTADCYARNNDTP